MNKTKKLSQSKSRQTMNNDLEEIFSYFSLTNEEKSEKFDSIVSDSIKLSEKIQDKLTNGTQEEKEEMEHLLLKMAEKVQEETDRICDEMGVTQEDLIAFTKNPENFSKEEWEAIQEAKDYIKEVENQAPAKKEKTSSKRVDMTEWVRS